MVVSVYERLYRNLDAPSIPLVDWPEKLSPEESEQVLKIEQRLQAVMDKFLKEKSDFVFVKTSSRSAKDAPMAQSRFKGLYQEYFAQEPEELQSTENTQITCLLRASFCAMRVHSAREVLDMVMRSERIYQDFLMALQLIIMYIYHALINALSAHMIHINLNMIFYTHVKHSPTKTIYIKYY